MFPYGCWGFGFWGFGFLENTATGVSRLGLETFVQVFRFLLFLGGFQFGVWGVRVRDSLLQGMPLLKNPPRS